MKRILLYVPAGLLLLGACTAELPSVEETRIPIVITAGMDNDNSLNTRVANAAFQTNDTIGVTMTMQTSGTEIMKNQRFVRMADGSWEGRAKLENGTFVKQEFFWPDATQRATITAYYPYTETPDAILLNAAVAEGTPADVLYSNNCANQPAGQGIKLGFKHVLSRLVIRLLNTGGVAQDKGALTVSGVIPSGTYNATKNEAALGTSTSALNAIYNPNGFYYLLMPPQTIGENALIINCTGAGITNKTITLVEPVDLTKRGKQLSIDIKDV